MRPRKITIKPPISGPMKLFSCFSYFSVFSHFSCFSCLVASLLCCLISLLLCLHSLRDSLRCCREFAGCSAFSGAPHFGQKVISSLISAPHFGQFGMMFTLVCLICLYQYAGI